jgi:glycosyltransferase involved in cell wall biosynthesis
VELLTGRVDVFHATNFVLPPLARAAGVVTVHDLTYLRFPETVDTEVRRYRELVPDAVRRAARVVTVSRAVADELTDEYSLEPGKLVVAPNGVSGTWSTAQPLPPGSRQALGLPERYLLFVGNREPRKNLGTLVRAHAAARHADTDVPPLVVVGPAGWGDAWSGAEPDPAHVRLLGYLDDDDLLGTVAGAVAVCCPSVYEGFGLPVVEAMAAGTPVLASDIAAHREVAGGFATLLPAGDADAWAGAIVAVAGRTGGVPAGTPEPARAHASRFTWRSSAEIHLEAYAAAADRP